MVCLDSDVLIDFLRNEKYAVKILEELSAYDKLFITSINSFEIFKGLKGSRINTQNIFDFISKFSILDFNFKASEKAAEIFNQLKSEGQTIELSDIMIASIVIINNQTLLTRNINHFERIKELNIEKVI